MCPSSRDRWAESTCQPTIHANILNLLPLFSDPVEVHIKTKTQDGHPHKGLLFSCQLLERVLCGIAKDIQVKTTEKMVLLILQGWKIKPRAFAPFFITSLTHWCISFLALRTGYISLLLLAAAKISGSFSKTNSQAWDFDELMPLLPEVGFRTVKHTVTVMLWNFWEEHARWETTGKYGKTLTFLFPNEQGSIKFLLWKFFLLHHE